MMEILFRGKRLDNGAWETGSLVIVRMDCHDAQYYIADKMTGYHTPVDSSTVGQYTGLKDKNCERIFEGDVCRFREWSNGEMCWVGKVHWEHQQFMISGGPNKECETMFELCLSRFISENIEVIGNITDNPELLEK